MNIINFAAAPVVVDVAAPNSAAAWSEVLGAVIDGKQPQGIDAEFDFMSIRTRGAKISSK